MMSLLWIQGILLVSGLIAILFLRKKYRQIKTGEIAMVTFLYVILVLLFTDVVVNWLKALLEHTLLND